ncbi:uncharacterized protein [Physcomitrium patens]|uniref:Uncharacterized protein n=2 Tax=Physcomitrium patens TaxID=3218 RepID=A9TQQ7_PHYPA|nr:uncharacterized protein LOC112292665 [Physcomitrium patens]XP_024397150.1 uncharacterized protein LOC112292665 [Physcomitrium patens]XP_024397151.1 uncharacterized protein LOC112292665 [Physcomitrium patens]XP_024397152.1 uncharacterized protein LOC112292665 [Physcomitrium patens]XP_024397153.1 uncharacterized protein LOC112292665 [Physcomitrium patens]XP_024397154.1 uncharacterized protein LOC112292665 [Physcomitrium patens]XP_024397155.1 uncharacterized protein LOC112292665 [Physcomitriu|eukprot:XP_024397149.1 uncharacterized protein LOC112292665 [Physcomitrella patens]
MGLHVFTEIGTLIWSHPYVSCSLLVFLTPPFFPILKYFSPLFISTALFFVALVTMGPQFEEPSDEEGDFLISSEEKSGDGAGFRKENGERGFKVTKRPTKDFRSTWSDWVNSCKAAGLAWVEQKLQNETWKTERSMLNDDNVSILQEGYGHRSEEKPRVLEKLATRRIPDEDESVFEEPAAFERPQDTPVLSTSDSWKSERSYERPLSFGGSNTRDISHNIFSPHPSFSRRHDSDASLFENFQPPPIDYDMPPLITGPASITAPLFKSLEDDMYSDDEDDHHHCDHDDHMHLEVGEVEEVGERSLDGDFVPQEELLVANGIHDHPPASSVQSEERSLLSSGESDKGSSSIAAIHQENGTTEAFLPSLLDETLSRDIDESLVIASTPIAAEAAEENTASPANHVSEDHSISTETVDEKRTIPAEAHCESSQPKEDMELSDVPELEDISLLENTENAELHAISSEDVTASHEKLVAFEASTTPAVDIEEPEVPADSQNSEVLAAPTDVAVEPSHVVQRSLSLPVRGSLADHESEEQAPAHEVLPPLDEPPEEVPSRHLTHAISLPAALNPIRPIILPPKTTDHGPLSPDTELGTVTTLWDHERPSITNRGVSADQQPDSIVSEEIEHAAHEPEKQLSTKEKVLNLEALCESISAAGETKARSAEVTNLLKATTEEQLTHVAEKMKSFMEDSSPLKKFQPDAPQLQITPPSTKVPLTSSPSKTPTPSPGPTPSIRPPLSATRTFSSRYDLFSSEESGDEEIDLDSDVDVVGSDSDSDSEMTIIKSKAPPKVPPATLSAGPQLVQA